MSVHYDFTPPFLETENRRLQAENEILRRQLQELEEEVARLRKERDELLDRIEYLQDFVPMP